MERFVAHLQADTPLADATVRRVLAPVKACLADATARGDIAANPAAGCRVRNRPQIVEHEDEHARALTRGQLAALIAATDPQWRPLVTFLASTGLRISEALALRWKDLSLGNSLSVKVVRAVKVGGPHKVGPPKSRASRRRVPLSTSVAMELRLRRAESGWPGDDDLVFCSSTGTVMSDQNLRSRTLIPAARAAGVPWASFHTLRHTFASLLFAEGRNIRQVQALLGHADPAFTLRTYVHLLDGDVGGPLDLAAVGVQDLSSDGVVAAATPVVSAAAGTGDT